MVFLTRFLLTRAQPPDRYWRKAMYFRMSWRYLGRKRNCFSLAIRGAQRAMKYSTQGRRNKKIYMRELWTTRLKAACAEHGLPYPLFMTTLSESNIALNRKVLADLSIYEPRTFQSLTVFAKQRSEELGITCENLQPPPGIITRAMLKKPKTV